MRKYFYISLILWISVVFNALSQATVTCGSNSTSNQVLHTVFAPDNCAGTPFYNLDRTTITRYTNVRNTVTSTITPNVQYATSATEIGSSRYGVVRQPQDAVSTYRGSGSMIILPYPNAAATLLTVTITGLTPTSTYTYRVDGHIVSYNTGACGGGGSGNFLSLNATNNPALANYNFAKTCGNVSSANETDRAFTYTSGNLTTNAQGTVTITISSITKNPGSNNNPQNIIDAIGISRITLNGCIPNPSGGGDGPGPGTSPDDPCPTQSVTKSNPCNGQLVAATFFDAKLGTEPSAFRDLNTIEYIGPEGAFLSVLCPYATSANQFGSASVYGVVDNPKNVNPDFPDINKSMLLVPTADRWGTHRDFLTFSVGGLRPGASYTVVVEGYLITDSKCPYTFNQSMNIDGGFNKASNGTYTAAAGITVPAPTAASPTRCFTGSLAITPSSPAFELFLLTPYNSNGMSCRLTYGITKIEVRSTTSSGYLPKIVSSQGKEVCIGEQVRFTLDKEYNACEYKWERLPAGSATWTTVGTSPAYIEEVFVPTDYRCTVNGVNISTTLHIDTTTCCNNNLGENIGSRSVLFYDDFGHFLSSSQYVTRDGDIIPTLCCGTGGPNRTIMPCAPRPMTAGWSTPLLPGVVFQAGLDYQDPNNNECRVRVPGHVAICAVPDMAGWYNGAGVGNVDADGNANGGVLLIDVATNMIGEVYRREIDGLCPGKKTYFQIDYAPGSGNSRSDEIILSIYEKLPGGTKGNRLATTGPITNHPLSWKTYKLNFDVPVGVYAVYLSVEIGKTDWSSAGEFMLDNVKFMVCTQPSVDAFSNLQTLRKDTVICGSANVQVGTVVSTKLSTAYAPYGGARFVYQYSNVSPTGPWTNIGGIVSDPIMNINMDNYPGQNIYFRMVVADENSLQTSVMIDPDIISFSDVCRTVSVSEPVHVRRAMSLGVGAPVTVSECLPKTLTLTGTSEWDKVTEWAWENAAGNTIVAKSSDEAKKSYTFTPTDDTEVYFAVYSNDFCSERQKFTIINSGCITPIDIESCPSDNPTGCIEFQFEVGTPVMGTGMYTVYNETDSITTIMINKVTGKGSVCIPSNKVVEVPVTGTDIINYHVYVAENIEQPAEAIESGLLHGGVLTTSNISSDYGQLIRISDNFESAKLDSAWIVFFDSESASKQVRFYVEIYKGLDDATLVCTGVSNTISYTGSPTDQKHKIGLGCDLEPGDYRIILKYQHITAGNHCNFQMKAWGTLAQSCTGNYDCLFSTPVLGKIDDGTLVASLIGDNKNNRNNHGYYILEDIKFSVKGDFALDTIVSPYRYELTSYCEITCTTPSNAVKIFSTKTAVNDTVKLCETESTTLSVGPLLVNGVTQNIFNIIWYETNKTSVIQTTPAASSSALPPIIWSSIPAGTARKFYVKVIDKDNPDNEDCWRWDSIFVALNEDVTVKLSGLNAVCVNESITLTAAEAGGTWTIAGADQIYATVNPSTGMVTAHSASPDSITVTYTIINGACTKVGTKNIKVNGLPNLTGTGSNSPVCEGGVIELYGRPNGMNTYAWSGPRSFNIQNPSISNVAAGDGGNYTLQVTDANGCSNSTTITVTVNPKPVLQITDPDPVCAPGTVNITAASVTAGSTGVASLTYYGTDGIGVLSSAQAGAISISGTYYIQAVSPNTCLSEKLPVLVTIKELPTAGINNPATTVLTCTTPSISLTATGGGSYSWSNGATGVTIDVTTAGTYTVTVTAANGCTDTESIEITADKADPTAGINNPATTVLTCTTSSISLTATGGGSYSWSNGSTGATIDVTTAGTYTVTVTLANGCTDTESIEITADQTDPVAGINNPATTVLTCTAPSISLTATGGGSYSWNTGATGATIDVTTPGTYIVTVTLANGCTDTESIEITADQTDPVAGINNPATTVLTCTEPSISLTATGGGSYSWNTGSTGATIDVTTAGTYTVTVTLANGCTDTESIEITADKVNPTAGINNPATTVLTCTTPSISLTATGGGDYSWNTGATGATIDVTTAGTYTVTVTSANGCTDTESIEITVDQTDPTAGINNPATTVLTCTITTISLTATGGGNYSWSTGATGATIDVITAGTYTVTVTSANGCTDTESIEITLDKGGLTADINNPATTVLTCTTPSITLTATGGDAYSWSNGTTGATTTVTTAGTYTVTVTLTENGCTDTKSIEITADQTDPTAGINNPATTVLTCTAPSISLTATGGGDYSWSTGATGATIDVTTAGTYIVTVTSANGCTDTESIEIMADKVNPTAGINNPATTVLTCTTPSISLTATGGGDYSWSTGATGTSIDVTTAGTYTVTVTAANGCTDTESIEITADKTNPTAGINNPATTVLTCTMPSISLTATGGGNYSWSTGATGATIDVTTAGTYTVTVTAANGCTDTESMEITADQTDPTAGINNPTTTVLTCTTPSISLTATGGGDYSWSTGATGAAIDVTTPGTYTVTVTLANGCTDTESIEITEAQANPTAGINNPATTVLTCAVPSISLTAIGGGDYSWSTGATGASISVAAPGTYTVTVTAANGCTDTESIEITEDKIAPTAGINNPVTTVLTCTTTSISLTATGGGNYLWSTGATGATINVTTAGTYTVTVTAVNGCMNTAFVEITQSDEIPTVNVTPSSAVLTCAIPSITLTATATGGDGVYTYSWVTADTTVVTPGVYTVKVTDGNGCSTTASATITQDKTPPTAGITSNTGETQLTCLVTSISLTATGGGSYSWSIGATSASINVTSAGTYTVTVTAANGCTATASIPITENTTNPVAGINNPSTTVLTCTTSSISLTATGGGNYAWSTGATSASINVVSAGTYTVTVTAANGCIDTESIEITADKTNPVAGINNPPTTVLTCTTPSISLTATGGVDYAWSTGATGATINVTSAGTYTVTVTATNGCTATQSIAITEDKTKPTVVINRMVTELTCTTTSISLTAAGGETYTWSHGATGALASITEHGAYTVTVTAANGCTNTGNITITSNITAPIVNITSSTTVLTCAAPSIALTATGGDTYVWDNGHSGAGITVATVGNYTVTAKAANGCTGTASITITSEQSLPDVSVNDSEICLGDKATLTASGADTYTWTPATDLNATTGASVIASPTTTTTYTVEGIVTATGCKNTTTATVYVETPLILTLDAPASIELGNRLTITVNATGPDHGNYEWFINNGAYKTTGENYITLEPAAGRQLFRVDTRTDLNCPASSEIFVDVTESVPNVINPYDPNGRNCCFMRGYSVEIYNRYMQKVFEGNDGWDGTYRGALADPGTYFYRLFKKSGQVEKGTLEIVKF